MESCRVVQQRITVAHFPEELSRFCLNRSFEYKSLAYFGIVYKM